MSKFIELNDSDLARIIGCGNFFEDIAHGNISGAFGREGKPFIGSDFTSTVAAVASATAIIFPPAAPIALPVGGIAEISSKIEEKNRDASKK